jgi:mRNA interferase MazF
MSKQYIPNQGDLIYLNFTPQKGREQSGRRPALVLSPKEYNKKTGLAIVCPITNQQKNYPFEINLPHNLPIKGVILSDHVKNLDWVQRKAKFIKAVPKEILHQVTHLVGLLINPS